MSLYRNDILDHYHHPQNFGKPKLFTHSYEDTNITCGDKQTVYLMVEGGVIQQANFEGTGCAISIASTSILTERLVGMSANDVNNMGENDMRALLGTEVTPSRMNCAMLGLRSFQNAITSHGRRGQKEVFSPYEGENKRGVSYVTKDSNLGEIAAQYPQAARVFTEYGLHCVGCFASAFDTVEAGASIHGMGMEEIEDMIKRANEEIALHPEECLNHESGIMNQENITLPNPPLP